MVSIRSVVGATVWAGLRTVLVLTAILGLAYPLAITGVAQALFPAAANGSIVTAAGRPVGSALIGQDFLSADGKPLRQYFQPRPSAAGADGYDPRASGGSNLGPDNPQLAAQIEARRAQVAAFNGVPGAEVPPDAVTASGSGLDPDISVAYALIQVNRVAAARNASPAVVRELVGQQTQQRTLGLLGEPVVNVLALNIALDRTLPTRPDGGQSGP
jgi:K+-transporting ATPase ATPase C chain